MSDGGNVPDSGKGRKLGTVEAPPERTGGDVAPMPPVGTSVAILVAIVVACGALFLWFLGQHRPQPGWAAFFAGALAIWGLPRYLPGLRERQALRQARKEAKRLLKAVRQATAKQKTWTGENARQKLEDAAVTLEKAIPQDDLASIEFASKKLDELADQYLARKAPAREYAEQIGGAVLAALFLRAFFYEAFRIPSPSMVPTLLVGDHLFVNKFVYGLRIPFTLKKLFTQVPERGDIVVFNKPGDESGDDIIKRVIGLPGDLVQVYDRKVTICPGADRAKCQPLEVKPLSAVNLNYDGDNDQETEAGPFATYQQFEEKVGRHTHVMQAAEGRRGADGEWLVEPGHVFLMGDNRDNSLDSRYALGGPDGGFGQVPLNYIKGRADIIWLSIGGPHGLRFSRMFSLLP